MDIYAKNGTKVVYTGKNGNDYDQQHADKYLKVGNEYTVHTTIVDDWDSTVNLKEVPGKLFNTVHFEDIEK